MVTKVPRVASLHKLGALYDWLDKYVTDATDVDSAGSSLPALAAINQGAALIGYGDLTANWSQIVRPIMVQINETDFLANTIQYIPRPLFNGGTEGSGFGGGGGAVMGYIVVVQKALVGPGGGATHGSLKLQKLSSGSLTDIPGSTNDLGASAAAAGTFFQSGTAIWDVNANLGIFDSLALVPTHGGLTAGALNCIIWVTNFTGSGS